MIGIIDYGMGNIHSVQKALESLGAKTMVTHKPEELKDCLKIVLPGVGAFGDAILELKSEGLIAAIREHLKQKKIFLGICLGMQVLFDTSDEAPQVKGLGVLSGKVKKFEIKKNFKVPHMGWNQLKKVLSVKCQVLSECPLLKGIPDCAFVYFCHSYYPEPESKDIIATTTDYGIGFASIVWQDNIYGVQFHPEKSQKVGLKILKNFVNLMST